MGKEEKLHITSISGPHVPSAFPVSFADMLRAKFGDQFEDLTASLPKHPTLVYEKRSLNGISAAAIHHTDTSRAITWQAVARYHVSQGWPGCGYSVGIRLYNGRLTVSLLNDLSVRCFHAHAWGNEHCGSIALMGNYATINPEQIEVDAAHDVVAVMRAYLGRPLSVMGHRDVPGNDTTCPGDRLVVRLPEIAEIPAFSAPIERLKSEALALQLLYPNPDAALQKNIYKDGLTITSNEFAVSEDGGPEYIGQLAQSLQTGEMRVYFVKRDDWENVSSVPI